MSISARTPNTPTALCVHQSAEQYGSDRMFALSVAAIRDAHPDWRIVVHLPGAGPLVEDLAPIADEVRTDPMWVLRKSTLRRRPWEIFGLPGAVVRARSSMRAADLVYVNTIVVLDHLIAARLVDTPTIAHIHEVAGSRGRSSIFSALLRWSRAGVVFNSLATSDSYRLTADQTSTVVHNGVAGPATPPPLDAPGDDEPIHVLAPGRLHPGKGQHVLIDAIAALPTELRARARVRIVGDEFGGEGQLRRDLEQQIAERDLSAVVTISGFEHDLAPLYEWAHIVVQPSSVHESFGLVAAEGMAFGRAVIATDVGALAEVVATGTGLLIPADDAAELAAALTDMMRDPDAMTALARRGRVRYERKFTREQYCTGLAAAVTARFDGS